MKCYVKDAHNKRCEIDVIDATLKEYNHLQVTVVHNEVEHDCNVSFTDGGNLYLTSDTPEIHEEEKRRRRWQIGDREHQFVAYVIYSILRKKGFSNSEIFGGQSIFQDFVSKVLDYENQKLINVTIKERTPKMKTQYFNVCLPSKLKGIDEEYALEHSKAHIDSYKNDGWDLDGVELFELEAGYRLVFKKII